jgi:hypothetical protein
MEITNEECANGIIDDNETESDAMDDLTESSEHIFMESLARIIADRERASLDESLLSLAEVKSISEVNSISQQPQQPQLGYFLPIAFAPRRRSKRFSSSLITSLFRFLQQIFL